MNFLKKSLLAATLPAMLWMTGCDSDSDVEKAGNIIPIPGCKVTNTTTVSERSTSSAVFTYNSNGYPSSQTYTATYIYSGGQQTESWKDEYVYEGNKIVEIVEKDLDGSEYGSIDIEWSDDKIVKLSTDYNEDGVTYTEELRYEYAGNLISKISFWGGEAGTEFEQYGYEELTWANGNITRAEYFDLDEASGARVVSKRLKTKSLGRGRINEVAQNSFVTFEYDDKGNPLQFFGFVYADPALMSANNVTKEVDTEVFNGNETVYTKTAEFTYNEEGFPTNEVFSWNGGEQETITNEYDCN